MNILSKLTAKGRIAAVLMLGFVTLVSGCREEDPPAISVSQQMFRVGTDAQELSLRVMSNAEWTASYSSGSKYDPATNSGWLTLSREKGRGSDNLTIFVEPYKGDLANGRQAILTFSVNGAQATVIINQSEQNTVLQVIPSEFTIGGEGGNVYFTVLSNTTWNILGNVDWATISPTSGEGNATIKIEVDENPIHSDALTREVAYQVTAGHASQIVTEQFLLTQKGKPDPTLILAEETVRFPANVSGLTPYYVPIITNVDLSSVSPTASTGAAWCVLDINDNIGVWAVSITPTNNTDYDERTAIVTVTVPKTDAVGGFIMRQIKVIQAGADAPTLTMSRTLVNLPAKDATAADLSVTATIGYIASATPEVLDYPSWFTSAPTVSNGTIIITADPNYSTDSRTGSMFVVVQAAGGKHADAVVNFIQEGSAAFDFTVTPEAYTAPVAGGTLTVFASSRDDMTITAVQQTNGSWVTLPGGIPAAQHATGSVATYYELPLTIDANTDANERTATVQVLAISGDQQQMRTVTISQPGIGGPQITILPPVAVVPNVTGETVTLAVVNGSGVTIENSAISPTGWITATPNATTDPTSIELAVTGENTTQSDRKATLYVWVSKGGQTQMVEVTITQPGVGAPELEFVDLTYRIGSPAKTFSIAVLSINGTTWDIASIDAPVGMFTTNPVKNGDAIDVSVSANTLVERAATINLLATNGDASRFYTLTIVQEGVKGPDMSPIAEDVYVGAAATVGGSEIKVPLVNYENDITINSSLYFSNSEMFNAANTIIGYEGTAPNYTGAFLQIAVTGNEALSERTGTIKITATRGGQTQIISVNVTQAAANAPQLIFPDVTYAYGVAALTGTRIVFLNPNDATVEVLSAPSWISNATPAAGNPTAQSYIEFDVAANDTSEAREGYIVIEAAVGANKAQYTIIVSQAGLAPIGASLASANITVEWNVDQNGTPAAAADRIVVNDLPPGAAVTATSSATWLIAGTPATTIPQSTIELTTTGINPRVTPRNATVTIVVTRGTETQTLTATVVQEGAPGPVAYLITDKIEVGPDPGAGTYPFDMSPVTFLNYNSNVTYGTPYSDATWLSATVSGDAVEPVIASANTASETRTGTITIPVTAAGQTNTVKLTVVQYGAGSPVLTMSASSLVFGPAAQTGVSYYFNNDSGATVTVLSAPAWLSNPDVSNINNGVYIFDVDENDSVYERTGTIVFKAAQGSKTAIYSVAVAQNGLMPIAASISPSTATVDASTAGAIDDIVKLFNVPANTTVNVSSSKTWLTIPTPPAAPNWTFTPEVTANDTGAMRSGTITVEITRGTGVTQEVVILTLTVTQLALDVPTPAAYLDMSQVNFDAALPATTPERTITINNVKTAYNYFVTKPDWVTVTTPAAGEPTTTFTVVPTGDNTGAQREGNVTIMVVNGSKSQELTLKVIQAAAADTPAPNVVFQNNLIEFGNAAENLDVNVYNYDTAYSVSWTAPSWVTITDNLPSAFNVAVPANTGVARSGLVTATITNGNKTQVVEVRVTQAGPAAPVAPAVSFANNLVEFTFNPAAPSTVAVNGASAVLSEVDGNGIEWSYPAWITVDASGFTSGSITLTAATNDTGVARTGSVTAVVKGNDGGSKALTINIVQAAEPKAGTPNISFVKDDVQFDVAPGGAPQTVALNGWDNSYDFALTVPSWITPSFDTSTGYLTLTADDNTGGPRSGMVTIRVTNGNSNVAEATLLVEQAGVPVPVPPTITLSQRMVQFAATDDSTVALATTIIDYDSSLTYTVDASTTDFNIEMDPSSLTEPDLVMISPKAANTTTSLKKAVGTITVTDPATGLGATATIDMIQLGLSDVGVVFPTGPITLTYQAMTGYSVPIVNPNDATIEITGASGAIFGTPSGESVDVNENTTGAKRSGTLTVTATLNGITESATIPYVQNSKGASTFNPTVANATPINIGALVNSTVVVALNNVPDGATTTVSGSGSLTSSVSLDNTSITFTTTATNGGSSTITYDVIVKVEYQGTYKYLNFKIIQQGS